MKRVISFLMALVMVVLVFSPTQVSAKASDDYTLWRQTDSEWNQKEAWPASQYPNATKRYMSQAGCLVTSIAMLLRQYNIVETTNVSSFNPWICNEKLKAADAFTNAADLRFADVEKAFPGFKYIGNVSYSANKLVELYRKGYACVIAVNNNGHFVAVQTASDTSKIVIMDPGWGYTSLSSFSSVNSIYYYTGCNHKEYYSGAGVCSKCGYKFVHTLNTADAGIYKIVKDFTPRTDGPYDAATEDSGTTLKAGNEIEVTGSITNAYENKWYQFTYGNGKTGYVFHDRLSFVGYGEQDISCIISSPAEGATVPKAVYNLIGTVNSKYPLKKVEAYIDGKWFATVMVDNKYTLDLKSSDINDKLDFAALSPGEHSLVIKAHDIHRGTLEIIIRRNFVTEGETACSHSYNSVVTAPTCTAKGYTTYTCKSCGYSYTGNTTDATGHSYGEWVTDTPASCTVSGTQKSTCSACGDVKSQTVAASGHNYTSKVVDATCVEYEKTIYTCTDCGDSYVEYSADDLTDWSTTKPSGVDESLIESRTEYRYQTKEYTTGTSSSMDGWTLYDTTTQWSDYGEWSSWSGTAVSASDTTKVETRKAYGYYYYLCSRCGAHMHGYGNCYTWAGGCGATTTNSGWREVWSATAWDNAGLKDWYGTGKYYAYIDGQLAFQWTSGGTKTQYRYCTRAQETVYSFYKWSDWTDWSSSPSNASDDVNVETRTVYRYVEAELGDHKYTSTVTAPTCNAQGYTSHTCSVCGDIYKDNYTAALDHSYSYAVTKAPTTSATGTLTGTCAKCPDTTTVTLPKLSTIDYTYKVTKEPSYAATGTGRYTWNTTTYGTFYFDATLDKLTATLTKVEVASKPTKTVYEIGESLDTTGLALKATYGDGSTKTITSGFTTSGFNSSTAGEKTVTVTYDGKTTTFTVTVEEVQQVDPNAPQIVLESKSVTKGNTVTLNLGIKNNPGFCALQLAFIYDKDYLTLTSVENQVSSMVLTSGSAYVWDAPENNSEDGTLAVLTFEVADDAPEGDYEIQVYFMGASNEKFEEVEMTGVSGLVKVTSIVYGDANGDGKVTTVDLAMLRRYLAAMDPITGVSTITVQAGADVNGDGNIGTVDLAMLRRYLAAMDPVTGESTIVLGPR